MLIQEKVDLAPYTTLGVGGPARYFADITNEDELMEALAFAKEQALSTFVLGGGSNLLVSDAGFDGVVLRMAIQGIRRDNSYFLTGAGVYWDDVVDMTVGLNFAGLECLAGIPGTAGGTPVQNVGAYGQEVGPVIWSVRAWDTEAQEFVDIPREDCGFGYRTSIFNTTHVGRYIITRVDYRLRPEGSPNLSYADLARRFGEEMEPPLDEVTCAVRQIRADKGMVVARPDADGKYSADRDTDTRSAGSFFRNPVVDVAKVGAIALAAGVGDMPNWPAKDGRTKLPAAWLIEKAGFAKGTALGNAAISSKHTLALTNRGGATTGEVVALRDEIARVVREKFGVQLEQEPVNVG